MSQAQTFPSPPSPPPPRVTFEEFLAGDWGSQHVEWDDGAVVMMSPVTGAVGRSTPMR